MSDNVIEALARVMDELPGIAKKFHPDAPLKYKFRGIEEITSEVQGLFAKHSVVVVPRVQNREVVNITVNSNPWTDTYLEVEWDIYGPGGREDCVLARTFGVGRDNSDKGTNKAMTQCFKYLLLDLLCISDPSDDNDGTNVGNEMGYEEVNGEQIPLGVSSTVTRTGPGGVDATPVTQPQERALFAMVKGAYGKDAEAGVELSRILGRDIRHPREVWKSEFSKIKAQCQLDGAREKP